MHSEKCGAPEGTANLLLRVVVWYQLLALQILPHHHSYYKLWHLGVQEGKFQKISRFLISPHLPVACYPYAFEARKRELSLYKATYLENAQFSSSWGAVPQKIIAVGNFTAFIQPETKANKKGKQLIPVILTSSYCVFLACVSLVIRD